MSTTRVDKILVGSPTYKVMVGNVTRVKKIVVGVPISTASGVAADIDNIRGVDTTGAVTGSILVYNDITDNWEVGTDSAGLDENSIINLIDSDYVQARQIDLQRDSAFVTNIVDSDYVQARQITTPSGIELQSPATSPEYYIYVGSSGNKLSQIQDTRGSVSNLVYDQEFATLQEAFNFMMENPLADAGYSDYSGGYKNASYVVALEQGVTHAGTGGYLRLGHVNAHVKILSQNAVDPAGANGSVTSIGTASDILVIYGIPQLQMGGDINVPAYAQIGYSNVKWFFNQYNDDINWNGGLKVYDGSTFYTDGVINSGILVQDNSYANVGTLNATSNTRVGNNSALEASNITTSSSFSVFKGGRVDCNSLTATSSLLSFEDGSTVSIRGNLALNGTVSLILQKASKLIYQSVSGTSTSTHTVGLGGGTLTTAEVVSKLNGNVYFGMDGSTAHDVNNLSDIGFEFNGDVTAPFFIGDGSLLTNLPTQDVGTDSAQVLAIVDSDFTNNKTTSDLTEGSNLYYTVGRFDSDFALKTTTDLTEGTNLYYTTIRFDSDYQVAVSNTTTDSVSEGSTNLYYTTARFLSDFTDRLVSLTTDSVAEGANNLYYTKIRVDSDFDLRLTTKTTTDLAEGDNLYYTTARSDSDFDVRLATKTTTNLTEGDNLYYTTTRADSDFDVRLTTKTTTNLTEGDNLYYTTVRADSDFDVRLATKTTTNVAEGSNLYYTTARADSDFDVRLAIKSTDDLSEGSTNLYYTSTRVDSDISARDDVAFTNVLETFTAGLTVTGGTTTLGNIETTGYLRGPSTFTIDPSPHADSAGTLVILGNLQVDGTTTTINSTNISISDKNIILADSASNASEANGAGITVNGANATITYNSATDRWVFNKDIEGTLVGAYSTTDFDSDFGTKTTTGLTEGTNLYFTDARALTVVQDRLNSQTTDSVAEGTTNLYYTTARVDSDFDARLATQSTTNLIEGTNLYFTDARALTVVQDRLLTIDTDSVAEGSTNLYYTTTRADSAIDARVTKSFVENLDIDVQKLIVGPVDLDASYNLIMTPTIGTEDSVVADGELTYNPNTNLLTTRNVTVDSDLIVGKLYDTSNRHLQVLDSDGNVLWG